MSLLTDTAINEILEQQRYIIVTLNEIKKVLGITETDEKQ